MWNYSCRHCLTFWIHKRYTTEFKLQHIYYEDNWKKKSRSQDYNICKYLPCSLTNAYCLTTVICLSCNQQMILTWNQMGNRGHFPSSCLPLCEHTAVQKTHCCLPECSSPCFPSVTRRDIEPKDQLRTQSTCLYGLTG